MSTVPSITAGLIVRAAGPPGSTAALLTRGLVEALRRRRRRRRPRPRGRVGECFGLLGPERRRQDHDDRDPRRPDQPTPATSRCSASVECRERARAARPARHPAPGDAAAGQAHRRETLRLFRSFYRQRPDADDVHRARRSSRRSATRGSASSRADRSSGWRSPARSSAIPSCCSSTSRRPGSIRSRAASSGT